MADFVIILLLIIYKKYDHFTHLKQTERKCMLKKTKLQTLSQIYGYATDPLVQS